MIVALYILNIITFIVYYSIRKHAYTKKYHYDEGLKCEYEKYPFPRYEAIFLGFLTLVPLLGLLIILAVFAVNDLDRIDKLVYKNDGIINKLFVFLSKDIGE
jgi:hypothetical protein